MAHTLVIVESPTKARTIRSFLPKDFRVEASMGHVRDLPNNASEIPAAHKGEKWSNLGVNTAADFAPLYVVPKDKKKVVKELKDALKGADRLLLATDEDREGESISWHLLELLAPKVPVKRLVFHEITKQAIGRALDQTRELDMELVHAQETRRILDRLVGYTLSPLLWKKVAWGLSAGRVQSVAVRLLVQRERARRAFRSGSYWDLKAKLEQETVGFEAKLTHLDGVKIAGGSDFDENTGSLKAGSKAQLLNEAEAVALRAKVEDVPMAGGDGGGEAHRPQTGAPLHHQHPAAGGEPQAEALRPRNHARRPGALRAGLHHLHADRFGPSFRAGDQRRPRLRRQQIRQGFPQPLSPAVHHQVPQCPGGPRGHPPRRRGVPHAG